MRNPLQWFSTWLKNRVTPSPSTSTTKITPQKALIAIQKALAGRTLLDEARERLAVTDQRIATILLDFEAASGAQKKPSSAYLYSYLKSNPLPTDIEDIISMQNVPIELVAGVAQMLSKKSIRDKENEFKALCYQVCQRHKHTRLVIEHKMQNSKEFTDENGDVQTFVKPQHDNVVRRAIKLGHKVQGENIEIDDIDLNDNYDPQTELTRNVIEFAAYAGASIQYDIANTKPKGEEPVGQHYELRYPELKAA